MKFKIEKKVIFACILMFSLGFEMGGFQAVLRELSLYFSINKVSWGFLVSSQYLGVIIMPVVFGRVADRIGKKQVLLVFMSIFIIGTCCIGLSSWLPLTVIGFFLTGSGYGVCESVSTALLSDQYADSAHRYMNLSQAFLCIGAVIAPILTSLRVIDWRLVFLISSGVGLIALIVLLFEGGFTVVPAYSSSRLLDVSLFNSKAFVLLFVTMMIYVGLENGFGYFTESFFYDAYASSWGGYAISLYWASMAISRVITSMSSQNIFKQLRERFILVAVVFIALFVSNTPVFALLLCVAVGACYGPIWSYIMSLSAGMYPERTASVTGLISSACGIGGAVYPVFMSAIIANAPLGSGYLFLSVSSLVAFLLILIAHRTAVNP